MKNKVLKEPIYAERIVNAVKLSCSMEEMRNKLKDYHDNDIAQSFEFLNRAERNLLYSALDAKWLAEIISYIDNPSQYIEEIEIDKLAEIVNEMDADDAVDLWRNIDESVKIKRLPWLIILLFLGMGVSAVVGAFEGVVAVLPVVICFQSLILDMAGNVGTQSLAVTIRVLMDEKLNGKDKLKLTLKEMKIGFCNGGLLGVFALVCLGVYIVLFKGYAIGTAFLISGCVGVALLVSIIISSLVGTLVPIFFKRIKVDPAVASGPLITTVNDLVAVVTYYGLAWLFLIQLMHIV